MFTDDPEWHQCASEQVRVEYVAENDLDDKTLRDIADKINICLGLPETICKNGCATFKIHVNKGFKGENKKYMAIACIFYAQREMQSGARTKEEFASLFGLDLKKFTKTMSVIKTILFQNTTTKHMVRHRAISSDTLHRIVLQVTDIPADKMQDVKKTVHKFFDKIKDNRLVMDMYHIDKLNVGLVYMACRFLKINTTIKHISQATDTSMATIIKIESTVKQTLQRPPHSAAASNKALV